MLGVLWLALGVPERGHAQTPQANEPSSAADVEPPRLLEFPDVAVPDGLELPEDGRVEVTIEVAPDGAARLLDCGLSEALCAVVGEAIARASFEPARRGGTALSARIRITLQLAAPAGTGTGTGAG